MNLPIQSPPKKMPAGKRDLSAAVDRVHAKVKKTGQDPVDPGAVERIPEHLMLAAGDEPGRDSFFDHDDNNDPITRRGRQVYMVLGSKAALPDYRTKDGQRTHRSMITVPPKLRESVRELFGVNEDSELPMTTAIIALADYAAMMLRRDQRCLMVEPAEDEHAEERKAARKTVRRAAQQKK